MELKNLKKRIKELISSKEQIFITGHADLDLDAIGAIIGLHVIFDKSNKDHFVIIDDTKLEAGVEKILADYKELHILTKKELKKFNPKESAIIIVDTNKAKLTCLEDIVDNFKDIVIIDHHTVNNETIKAEDRYIYTKASSTCEIITELLIEMNINLNKKEATYVLSGIILDTNNFTLKADEDAFYYAYHLIKQGANPSDIQNLLKENFPQFIVNQKMLTTAKIKNGIAIANSNSKKNFKREDLAKVADSLLKFNGVEASFAIGFTKKDEVSISARSLGNLDVGEILELLEGGGNRFEAGTKLKEKRLKKVEKDLLNILAK